MLNIHLNITKHKFFIKKFFYVMYYLLLYYVYRALCNILNQID